MSSVFDTCSQPVSESAVPGMPRAALRTYSAPATEPAHSALARSRPTRSISASAPSENPGSTTPGLRPDALQAMLLASSTTTDQPRLATSQATVSPASPAPITQRSTSNSTASRGRTGASTGVAAYQFDP